MAQEVVAVALVVQVAAVAARPVQRVAAVAQGLEAAVVAEPPSSRGQDRTLQLPLRASRNRCASKGCKMRCSCRSDRYEPHCF